MKKKKLLLFVGIVCLILLGNHRFGWSSRLEHAQNLRFLERMVQENLALAVMVYVVLTAAGCVVLALPGVTFAIAAGLLFGPWLGTLCCLAATTLGAMAAFLAGRFFFKDSIRPLALKNPYLKKWLFNETESSGIVLLMITRLIPLFPYNLQNFAYGVTDIPFATYAICSFVFMLPGTAMYTIGAAGLADEKNRLLYLAVALVLAVGVLGIGTWLKRKYVQTKENLLQKKDLTRMCLHCHKCRQQCAFLKKYQIDLGDRERLKELAYHCFLCGRCSRVCPAGIDGRQTVLELRRERVLEHGGRVPEKGYAALLLEKKHYLYRNYRHAAGKSVLFLGCNFPSVYPETTKKLVELARANGIGAAYDCCGKPVAELGLEADAKNTLRRIEAECKARGIGELVVVCPNCFYYLREHLEIRVTGIYEKLEQLGIGNSAIRPKPVFLPCPDRDSRELFRSLEHFAQGKTLEVVRESACCGLGGCAAAKEPKLSGAMVSAFRNEKLYTYCASCSWSLGRDGGAQVSHVLTEILETREKPDIQRSGFNRMKTKLL